MKRKRIFWICISIGLTIATLLATSACASPSTVVVEKEVMVTQVVQEVVEVEKMVTPAPHAAEEKEAAGSSGTGSGNTVLPAIYRVNRMIVKNAELQVLVVDTAVAVDAVTQITADTLGYIVSARSWYQNGFQYATITIGVPVHEFENAMRRLRGMAIMVQDEKASGTDVTDQYVDLESRLRNLEATEARIRSFLEQATSVEESLRVNQTLSEITAQIEEIKGQMSYLKDRSAYSTITVQIAPQLPTPTPTPTATPTPTPPPPEGWRPDKTFTQASGVLGGIMRTLIDLAIWITVLVGPFALVGALILGGSIRLGKRWRNALRDHYKTGRSHTDELGDLDDLGDLG